MKAAKEDAWSVAELVAVLYKSDNDAWRDDAAEQLAFASKQSDAEAALIAAIHSPEIDDSLRRTCAESLASIWIRKGEPDRHALAGISGGPREVLVAFLTSAGIELK